MPRNFTEDRLNEINTAHKEGDQKKLSFLISELIDQGNFDVINAGLVRENENGENLLHLAIRNLEEEYFEVLVKKASQKALSEAIFQQTTKGKTPLHFAAEHSSILFLGILLKEIDKISLDKAVLISDNENQTILDKVLKNSNALSMLELLSSELIKKCLTNFYVFTNPWHIAAKNSSSDVFMALVKKATQKDLEHGILRRDRQECTPLEYLLKNGNTGAVLIVIDKLGSKILLRKIAPNTTLFSIICNNYRGWFIWKLFDTVSSNIIDEALLHNPDIFCNILNSSSEDMQDIQKKISVNRVIEIVRADPKILTNIFEKQKDMFATLLKFQDFFYVSQGLLGKEALLQRLIDSNLYDAFIKIPLKVYDHILNFIDKNFNTVLDIVFTHIRNRNKETLENLFLKTILSFLTDKEDIKYNKWRELKKVVDLNLSVVSQVSVFKNVFLTLNSLKIIINNWKNSSYNNLQHFSQPVPIFFKYLTMIYNNLHTKISQRENLPEYALTALEVLIEDQKSAKVKDYNVEYAIECLKVSQSLEHLNNKSLNTAPEPRGLIVKMQSALNNIVEISSRNSQGFLFALLHIIDNRKDIKNAYNTKRPNDFLYPSWTDPEDSEFYIPLHVEFKEYPTWQNLSDALDSYIDHICNAFLKAEALGKTKEFFEHTTTAWCIDGRINAVCRWLEKLDQVSYPFDKLMAIYTKRAKHFHKALGLEEEQVNLTLNFIMERYKDISCSPSNNFGTSKKITEKDVKEYLIEILSYDDVSNNNILN